MEDDIEFWREEALDILSEVPLIDGHNDWPHLIRGFYDNKLDERFQSHKDLGGHVDLKRLVEGKSGGAFWSVYVDCPNEDNFKDDSIHFEAVRDTMQQIDLVHRVHDLYPERMGIVYKAEDVLELFKEQKFASLIGVEGLHQIANSASVLRLYHKLGVRYVTLAHNKNNLYADSATSNTPAHNGLSSQGVAMIQEMNRIGMIIDLSHTSDDVMHAVLEKSKAPVIFSHSSSSALVPSNRNVTDAVLAKLKDNNGVIMISFIPSLTHSDSKAATINHVVDHICHVANQIGYSHIGLGSDYDGMVCAVKGLEDVSKYPALVASMLARGIAREDIKKVLGFNIIRVLTDVENVSRAHKNKLPVLEDEVKQLWNDNLRAFVRQVYPNAERDNRV
ncbi:hypothetical protein L228DRAFT_218164 [Xylona heveae TC161]|uniref:Dipeptidase n=1 Tax=Xylona heveae (strain CBS 132557 / TC161) TaxID=1328760 RepID=A0A165HTP2_XYLHT|nr:hypothetical protein L228DRAFT_218164 [Xylona heveae TC161]KZF23919.1 hypothetical protein L228DRAFT_218164 [Xylona heveae TC161]